MKKHYEERDIMDLDEFGNHYINHVYAMADENLNEKSSIAAELGYRDMLIEKLTAERDKLARKLNDATSELEENEIKDGRLIKGLTESSESWKSKFEQAIAERDAALAQNAELVAMVERMRGALQKFHPESFEYQPNDFDLGDDVVEVLSAAPTQCLRDVKAEAVRDFILWGVANMDPEFAEFSDCAKEFISQGLPKTITSDDQYAERVKAGDA